MTIFATILSHCEDVHVTKRRFDVTTKNLGLVFYRPGLVASLRAIRVPRGPLIPFEAVATVSFTPAVLARIDLRFDLRVEPVRPIPSSR